MSVSTAVWVLTITLQFSPVGAPEHVYQQFNSDVECQVAGRMIVKWFEQKIVPMFEARGKTRPAVAVSCAHSTMGLMPL